MTPTAQAAQADAANRQFVRGIIGSATPSLLQDLQASFSLSLTPDAAVLLEAAYTDDLSPIGVMYELQFTGLRPALSVKAHGEKKKIYDHLQMAFHAGYTSGSAAGTTGSQPEPGATTQDAAPPPNQAQRLQGQQQQATTGNRQPSRRRARTSSSRRPGRPSSSRRRGRTQQQPPAGQTQRVQPPPGPGDASSSRRRGRPAAAAAPAPATGQASGLGGAKQPGRVGVRCRVGRPVGERARGTQTQQNTSHPGRARRGHRLRGREDGAGLDDHHRHRATARRPVDGPAADPGAGPDQAADHRGVLQAADDHDLGRSRGHRRRGRQPVQRRHRPGGR